VGSVPGSKTIIEMQQSTQAFLMATSMRAVMIVFAIMSIFEVAKMALSPSISVWRSHAVTIMFSAGLAGVAMFITLAKYERARHLATSIEARYRMLFESSPSGAYLISGDGRILDCNLSFCRIFGHSRREELIGRSIDLLFPSGAEQSFYFSLIRSGKALENVEHRLQRKDGSDVWVLHSALSVAHERGVRSANVRGTMADVTVIRQAEYKEHRLAAIVRCTDYAVIALTPEGIIEAWNGGAERIFGYTTAEAVGRSISIISSPEHPNEYLKILEDVKARTEVEVETTRTRKDGQSVEVALSVSPIHDGPGNVIGVAAIIRDIRDRKHAERALLHSAAQYRLLFEGNPVPMWVFDRKSLRFLAVNNAAVRQYGFTAEDFLKMTIADIRPESSVPALFSSHNRNAAGLRRAGEWQHRTRDNRIIDVEIVSHTLEFEGRDAELVAAYDITDRNRAEENARNAERNYRSIFDNAVLGMFQSDLCGRPIAVNHALAKIHGFESPEQMLNEVSDVLGQLFVQPLAIAKNVEAFDPDEVRAAEADVYRRDGSKTRIRMNLRASRDRDGRPLYLEGMVEDIGEQRRAEAALLLKTTLLEAESETTIDGILAVDGEDRILIANKQFRAQFGIPEELLLSGKDLPVRNFVLEQVEDPVTFIGRINYLNSRSEEKSSDEISLKSGRSFDRYSSPLIDSAGRNWGRIWYFREITERKAAEKRIQSLAYFDALTELPNRTLLRDRLDNALAAARRRNERVALLHIDLDCFKAVNETLGHVAGDAVLKKIAGCLRATVRDPDTVARTEGDGFVVILNGVADLPEAGVAARRIKDAITVAYPLDVHELALTATIGIAVHPDHGHSADTLIKNAESAMYSAKEAGRNAIRFFSSEINGKALELMALESEMRNALERNQMFLVYQPQIDLLTGGIIGLEALLRWRHPDLGLVPPDKFIPIAERNGLILAIGEWVLRTACEQTRSWQIAGLPVVPVGVNVSAIQFRSEAFASQVQNCLLQTGLCPELLDLELTETMLFDNAGTVHECLRELQAAGVKISLDDFGTGYSSLSYLKQFRVNRLKIDRSFIKELPGNYDDAVIAKAIISMAKSLNITIIAEGVETDAQVDFLKEYACDQIQGYWFSKPESAEVIAKKLVAQCTMSTD